MISPIRLTDIAIRNLKPKPHRYELPDPGARGLYVVIHPSGRKSFAVRYRHAGLSRKLTLQGGISLAAARKLCADALHEVTQNRDPSAAKKVAKAKTAAAAVNTLQYVAEEYFAREHGKLRTAAARESAIAPVSVSDARAPPDRQHQAQRYRSPARQNRGQQRQAHRRSRAPIRPQDHELARAA